MQDSRWGLSAGEKFPVTYSTFQAKNDGFYLTNNHSSHLSWFAALPRGLLRGVLDWTPSDAAIERFHLE